MGDYDGRCGSCGAFTGAHDDPRLGRVGQCGLNIYPPPVKATATCTRYRPKGAPAPPPPPRAAGEPRGKRTYGARPVATRSSDDNYRATDPLARSADRPAPPPRAALPQEVDIDMDISEFRRVLREVLSDELGTGEAELGGRWEGGEIILKPGKPGLQEKRIPLDVFFKKIVMVRDKLRVLEQKVNGSELTLAEKVQLQQYITGCYGSLTTFNVLFSNKEDQFVGQGKDED